MIAERSGWCWRWLAAAAAAVLGTGCGSQARGPAFQPEVVDPGKAVVYVFRDPKAGLNPAPVLISVDQHEVGDLDPGQYIATVVAPGEHLVRAERGRGTVLSAKVVEGDVVYFRVTTPPFKGRAPVLEIMDSETARRSIAGTTRAGE
jgi:hypothetical protein